MHQTYCTLIDSYGGDLEPDQLQEYCVLIYNLALTRFDIKQFSTAEQFLSRLYHSCQLSLKDKSNNQTSDLHFALDQMLPLLISLNLYMKNPMKALNLISKAENKGKQDSDVPALQRLFLCHALALVQSKAFKSFKRDLKPNGLTTMNQVTYEFLRANLEFAKGNARKAMKLLSIGIQLVSSVKDNDMDVYWVNYINSLYLNNLGCLHLLMKKPNLGVYYLHQASDSHSQALTGMSRGQSHFLLRMKKNEITYNSAMNLLHAGQPTLAFWTLVSILPSLAQMPNIWLR